MPTHTVLTPSQWYTLEHWEEDLTEPDLIRHYWLSDDDHTFIDRHRGPHNRLGVAVQLAYLRHPGWPLDPQAQGEPQVVRYLATQIRADPQAMRGYAAQRPETQREHFAAVCTTYGYTPWSSTLAEQVTTWLFPHAIEHTHGLTLVRKLIAHLREQRIVLPALSTIEEIP